MVVLQNNDLIIYKLLLNAMQTKKREERFGGLCMGRKEVAI
jgi:hypothetical protein